MRVVGQCLDGLCRVSYVPKLGFAVVTTACQVVLLIWVKVKVTHELRMRVLDAINLSVEQNRNRIQF